LPILFAGAFKLAMSDLVIDSQLITIAFSLLMVFIIIAVSNRSIAAGIIGGIPAAYR
jgi:predicted RND superfamily exporter protein